MINQTNNTKMGNSIYNGNGSQGRESKGMRVIDFTKARTQAEKQELFSECQRVMRGIFSGRQVN